MNQIKEPKTAGYLDTKDQDKKIWIICLYLQKIRKKNNKQIKKQVPKKIYDKEINQIKYLKPAGYLDTKDKDEIK